MKRLVLAPLLTAVLLLAPAASAKGPHATVDSGPSGLAAGEPWVTTLTLSEFGAGALAAARPTLVLRSGDERFRVAPKRVRAQATGDSNAFVAARYRLRVVFPRAGRWSYTLLDGTLAERRFRFPVAVVGGEGERSTAGYVAFPDGSEAAAQGAGGPYDEDSQPVADGDAGALPPKLYESSADVSDESSAALLIPAGGLALAGLGAVGVLRRRRRSRGRAAG